MQWPEVTGLLDKVGVKMNTVKSGSMKAEPSPFKPLDDENRQLLDAMIAAVEELTAQGVADMLPPGQYNRVLVVDDQAESLRELTAITPQRRAIARVSTGDQSSKVASRSKSGGTPSGRLRSPLRSSA